VQANACIKAAMTQVALRYAPLMEQIAIDIIYPANFALRDDVLALYRIR